MDERITRIIEPSVRAMNFRLVRVRLMGGERPTLQIMAEKHDGSMDVDDCAELSHAVSAVLDVEDPIDGEYVLEVSSPGIDRPLTRAEDFERYEGFEAKLETRELLDGRKRWRGEIVGVASETEDGPVTHVVIEYDIPRNEEGETSARIALALEALSDARLVMTDALIEESLKRGGAAGKAADGQEVDLDNFDAVETEFDASQDSGNEDTARDQDNESEGGNNGRRH
ncbi:MAG: ribosome maturation factor RimP [Neomegalonema sp.]|nr:ribosome maturation factor RimP [Neomegalonema sp.]